MLHLEYMFLLGGESTLPFKLVFETSFQATSAQYELEVDALHRFHVQKMHFTREIDAPHGLLV